MRPDDQGKEDWQNFQSSFPYASLYFGVLLGCMELKHEKGDSLCSII